MGFLIKSFVLPNLKKPSAFRVIFSFLKRFVAGFGGFVCVCFCKVPHVEGKQ